MDAQLQDISGKYQYLRMKVNEGKPNDYSDQKYRSQEKQFEILTISETWLNDQVSSDNLMIQRYNLIRKDKNSGRGGGVLLYIPVKIKYDVIKNA
ncbi:unnamed protein product [Acanthoscelides obtectus]|uniref:Uncharacterized protein n=1 Tax=Acanthoscelides obtectus TaxID=200917 RepID=A0A9P0LMJ0_ACAOB|nr:unnamed protein product [Acanthoscelides obtectus]CAK1627332.1 hypothetical protein AOBTE_LOCUS4525 [Acanthoscelides obtectus]